MKRGMDREEIRTVGFLDRIFLGHFCFPRDFRHPNAESHYDLNDMLNGTDPLYAVMCHRHWAKSTILCFLDPTHQIGYCPRDDYRFLVIIAETQPQAMNHLARISVALEFNRRFRWLFGDLRMKARKWGLKEIITNNGVRVVALGTGQRVRGVIEQHRRPTRTYIDDAESRKNGATPTMRADNFRWLYSDVLPFRDKDIGQVFLTQSPIAHDCIIYRVMDDPNWVTMQVPLYEGELFTGILNWEEAWPWEKIVSERRIYEEQNMLGIFDQEYLLIPYKGEAEGITRDDIRFFDGEFVVSEMGIKYIKGFREIKEDGTQVTEPVNMLVNTFSSCDPALGETRTHDRTAMGTIGMNHDRDYIVLSATHFQRHSSFYIGNAFAEFAWDGRANGIGVETTGFQSAIGEVAQRWCDEHGVQFDFVRGFNPRSSKDVRLHWVVNKFKGRKVFIRPGQHALVKELLEWPSGAHDDYMDMLYMAMKIAYPPSYASPEKAERVGKEYLRSFNSIPSHMVT